MLPNTLHRPLCQQSCYTVTLAQLSLLLAHKPLQWTYLSCPFLSSQSQGSVKGTYSVLSKGWINEWKSQQQASREYLGPQRDLSEHGSVMTAVESSELHLVLLCQVHIV